MTDDESDVKASKMAAEHVKAYFIKTGMNFCFDEGRNVFTIPIKKLGDIEFELIFKVWAVMMQRGVGRIGVRHYLSVKYENALQKNSFLQNVVVFRTLCQELHSTDSEDITPWPHSTLTTHSSNCNQASP